MHAFNRHHQIIKPIARRIDILSQREINYFPSKFNEQQRISRPELQVRRLSQEDWAYCTAYNAYALRSIVSTSLSSSASTRSDDYEL
jgi:hypothetical protein